MNFHSSKFAPTTPETNNPSFSFRSSLSSYLTVLNCLYVLHFMRILSVDHGTFVNNIYTPVKVYPIMVRPKCRRFFIEKWYTRGNSPRVMEHQADQGEENLKDPLGESGVPAESLMIKVSGRFVPGYLSRYLSFVTVVSSQEKPQTVFEPRPKTSSFVFYQPTMKRTMRLRRIRRYSSIQFEKV